MTPVPEFRIDARVIQEGRATVAVHGSVDLTTAPEMRNRLAELIDDGNLCIVVDLTDTDFLDSTGLGALVSALKRLRMKDGEIRIVCALGHVRKVFEITSLDRVFAMFETTEDALA
ncbi:MAG: anti-sigma factor antagonist [Actinomycetota bacterium]|nr:anti-sigma factor antagonist [Actinomycetota bacterium]